MYVVATYLIYLALSLVITVWVAQTLYKNGRVFLVEAFGGNEILADSVNHLLVVGFYLINVGFVSVALRHGMQPQNLQGAIEVLSSKVGVAIFVLGMMHFFNLVVLAVVSSSTKARRRSNVAKKA